MFERDDTLQRYGSENKKTQTLSPRLVFYLCRATGSPSVPLLSWSYQHTRWTRTSSCQSVFLSVTHETILHFAGTLHTIRTASSPRRGLKPPRRSIGGITAVLLSGKVEMYYVEFLLRHFGRGHIRERIDKHYLQHRDDKQAVLLLDCGP